MSISIADIVQALWFSEYVYADTAHCHAFSLTHLPTVVSLRVVIAAMLFTGASLSIEQSDLEYPNKPLSSRTKKQIARYVQVI